VLLKLLETIWRTLLTLSLLAAALALVLWYSEENPLSSKVALELSHSPPDCVAKGWPILARIQNKSSKTIGEIDLKFRVYQQGTSKDVADYSNHEMNNIIKPGEELDWCFPMPAVEAGSTGPYTVAADVTYAAELPKGVPASSRPPPTETTSPPPIVTVETGPGPVKHRRTGPKTVWQSVSDLIGVAILFVLAGSAGFALIALADRAFKTRLQARLLDDGKGESGCLIVPFAGFLNMLIVGTGGSYVLAEFGWDGWITAFDDWSWTHGLADGGLLLLAATAAQWPWLVLVALPRRQAQHD
jgi:hypothetical protein